jgi:hypothetical protein
MAWARCRRGFTPSWRRSSWFEFLIRAAPGRTPTQPPNQFAEWEAGWGRGRSGQGSGDAEHRWNTAEGGAAL